MSCESFDCFAGDANDPEELSEDTTNDPEELSEDTGDALRLSS